MNREFLINIAFLLFVNLLIKPFYIFGIERVIQNRVADGEYGLYFNLFSFTLIFQIVNDLGIQYYNNRNIAQHNHLLAKYFPTMLLLKALLGFVYYGLLLFTAWLWGYEFNILFLLVPIALNQLLASLVLFLRSNISGLAMYRTDSLISVLDRLLLILICGFLLQTNSGFQIAWFVYAQTTSLTITALVAFLTFRSRLGKLRFRFQPSLFWVILRKSYPYALTVFLMGAYTRLDGVMIERLLPNGRLEADVYAAAYRLLDASNVLGFLFGGLLLPMFAKMLKEKSALEPLLHFSWQMIWAGSVSLATAVFFFQEEIMVALYVDGDAYAGQILGLLMITFIAISCTYIFGPLLTANANMRRMNQLFLVGVVLNVALNWRLIPEYGAWGAAIATLITQFLVAFGKGWLTYRLLPVRFDVKIFGRLIAFAVLCILAGYLLRSYFLAQWLAGFICVLIVCAGAAFAFRLVSIRGISALLQSQRPSE